MRRSFPFVDYFIWHYTVAFKDILVIWFNLVWFAGHFFSIGSLSKTLFSPWKRIHESYEHTGFEDLVASFVVNIMTRIVGAFIRIAIILVGLIVIVLEFVALLLWLVLWTILPLLVAYTLVHGVLLFV